MALYFMTFKKYGAAGMYPCSFRRTLFVYPQELNKTFEKNSRCIYDKYKKILLSTEKIHDTKLPSKVTTLLLSIKQRVTLHIVVDPNNWTHCCSHLTTFQESRKLKNISMKWR
jgi:hypothetical protein